MAHHHPQTLSGQRILLVTAINLGITIAEIVGGIASGSLALLSDSAHNLGDTFAIALSFVALRLSARASTPRRTYGYKRAEILVAFFNALVLALVSVYLIYQAILRFLHPQPILVEWMAPVAALGLAGNLVCVLLLHAHAHHSLNIRSGYLHLLGDTLSSVAVLGGAAAVYLQPAFTWVDPIVSLVISVYILKESKDILVRTTDILMQSSAELDYEAIKRDIEAVEGVQNIHHVHTWLANEHTVHFEAHVELADMLLSETKGIRETVEEILESKYGVSHITLQFECRCCLLRDIHVVETSGGESHSHVHHSHH